MSNLLDERCRMCGETLKRLMLLAMLKDAGATVSGPVEWCRGGKEHDFFSPIEEAPRAEVPDAVVLP